MTATLGKFGPAGEGHKALGFYRTVTLPDGFEMFCEVALEPNELMRGLMYREGLGFDEGMLFVFPVPMKCPIHMRNVLMPLDVVWVSSDHAIVELARGCQPCKSDECPSYGGHAVAGFMLELPAGTISRHQLKLGDRLAW